MCGGNLVEPRLIGGERRSSSGSFSMLAAMRRASSRGEQVSEPVQRPFLMFS
jgi:hypothetical protein